MAPPTTVSGPRRDCVRVKVSSCGKTAASTKAIGKMIKLMDREDLSTLMETVTSESGSMIKLMAEVLMNIWTAQTMSETGKKINSTDTALRHGQMLPSTKVTTNMERSTVSEPLSGLMALPISENFIITTFTAREFTHGQTTESTRVNGALIKCMEKGLLPGLTTVSISESTPKIRRRATENSSGQMAGAIGESGSMVNNTEKEHTLPVKASKNTVSGKKERESDG
jgi:hypothetical protein